jgi:hypothetical protein
MEVSTPRFMKLGEFGGGCIPWNGLTQANNFLFFVWVRLVAKFHEEKIILKNSKAQEEHIP